MTPALPQLPAAVVRHTRAPVHAQRILPLSLGIALLSNWWLRGEHWGVAVPVLSALIIGALAWAGGVETWQASKPKRWLLGVLLVFSGCLAFRDSAWLTVVNTCVCGWVWLISASTWGSRRAAERFSLGELMFEPVVSFCSVVFEGGVALVRSAERALERLTRFQHAGAVLRSALIATPVVAVLAGLLASGDAVFGARALQAVRTLTSWDLASLTARCLWVAVATAFAAGWLSVALARVTTPQSDAHEPIRRLGFAEATTVLGSVTLLLFGYDAVAVECVTSASACELPSGVTYAEYAHSGFFQLVLVAAVVLALVVLIPPRSKGGDAAARVVRLLSSALIVATVPVLLSAVTRLEFYEDAYGFTTTRVMAQAGMLACGALLILRGATLWVTSWRFAFGAVLTVLAFAAGLNALNLDRFVAERNLARGGALDEAYISSLSADVPEALKAEAVERGLMGAATLRPGE